MAFHAVRSAFLSLQAVQAQPLPRDGIRGAEPDAFLFSWLEHPGSSQLSHMAAVAGSPRILK